MFRASSLSGEGGYRPSSAAASPDRPPRREATDSRSPSVGAASSPKTSSRASASLRSPSAAPRSRSPDARSSPVGRPSNSPSIGSSSLRSRTLVSSSRQSSFARGNSTVSDDARTWQYSGSASASPAYASSPAAPAAVKSSKGKDKMSPVRMPAAGSSQVQVSRGSPRAQRQIKMQFDDDGTEIIMPALPFTAQSERQVWLDEAPRGPWPGPKNGGSMPSVTGVFRAWSAKKYAKVASVKSYKGGGKMLLRCSTRVKNGVVIGSDNEEGDSEVEILDDCDRCPFKAHIRTTAWQTLYRCGGCVMNVP